MTSRFNWAKFTFWFMLVLASCSALLMASRLLQQHIWYNPTISEPIGYYYIHDDNGNRQQLQRGEQAIITLPPSYMHTLYQLGYRLNSATLLKTVVASSGDWVLIQHNGVSINGKLLPLSTSSSTAHGVALHPLAVGYQHKLAANEYWVMGNTLHSYDSRYFGVVTNKQIVATARFLFD